jgi:hypothetical protein
VTRTINSNAALTRESRERDRRSEAYIEVLRFLEHWLDFNRWRVAAELNGLADAAPSAPTRESLYRVRALVDSYGSAAACAAFDSVMTTQRQNVDSAFLSFALAREEKVGDTSAFVAEVSAACEQAASKVAELKMLIRMDLGIREGRPSK